ncbi:hypothetical protein VB773_02645 [Haloarculaceae archaeon H-GB2-1]|nr:hypothetical protein [Haloarculaceae archaeon H-GB2-1]
MTAAPDCPAAEAYRGIADELARHVDSDAADEGSVFEGEQLASDAEPSHSADAVGKGGSGSDSSGEPVVSGRRVTDGSGETIEMTGRQGTSSTEPGEAAPPKIGGRQGPPGDRKSRGSTSDPASATPILAIGLMTETGRATRP